jgi:UDP-3-O-[3-hydroxymyristoyl] N-acetylglucosamine deacetylase
MTSHPPIQPLRFQNTLARSAEVTGFGYWSGRDVRVEFRPAAPDTGLVFVRGDLTPAVRIPAQLKYRVESPRRTNLRAQNATVEMVEHILAALAGLCIDNCEIWVDASEMPGCDGSSLPFVEALDRAGVCPQQSPIRQLQVVERVRVGDDNVWIEAHPCRGVPSFSVKFRIDYGPQTAIGRQTCEVNVTPATFRKELASSRTFVLKEEADWLRGQGIALRPTHHDLLIFDAEGPIDNPLRFPEECARHKALDLVGDLALAGAGIVGQFVAHSSGHRLNAELVRALLNEGQRIGCWRRSA